MIRRASQPCEMESDRSQVAQRGKDGKPQECQPLAESLLVLRHNGNRFTSLQVLKDCEQKILNRLRNLDLASVWHYKLGAALLNESTQLTDLFLLRFRDRHWIS